MVDLKPATASNGSTACSDDPPALLFFAFRRLTEEPDRVLALRGFGRVHHRILYFVARHPAIHIGGLLEILKVSKQALHRPLGQLVRRGLVTTAASPSNRRRKLLSLTKEGRALESRLTGSQRRRFSKTFRAVGPEMEAAWREVMRQLGES
jgi:DNA-binding MarR family transcriptional regulator